MKVSRYSISAVVSDLRRINDDIISSYYPILAACIRNRLLKINTIKYIAIMTYSKRRTVNSSHHLARHHRLPLMRSRPSMSLMSEHCTSMNSAPINRHIEKSRRIRQLVLRPLIVAFRNSNSNRQQPSIIYRRYIPQIRESISNNTERI